MRALRGWHGGHSRAGQLIDLLARYGAMTVREMVDALGVTTTAVREPVNRLLAEGWLLRRKRQGATGRPADVFSLSQKAGRLFGGQTDELPEMLLEALEEEVGASRGRRILNGVRERLVRRARASVGGGPVAERLHHLAELLSRKGDLVEASRTESGLRLTVFTCPFGGLADSHRAICEMERDAFSDLIGQPVKLGRCMPDGHESCEFTVSPPAPGTGRD